MSLPAAAPLTMSTIEIAGLTGKAHKNVLADVRKMLAELNDPNIGGVEPADFSARYIDAKGEARECFNLPKRECLILVSGYNIELRAKIIDRWMQLEAAIAGTAVVNLPPEVLEMIRRDDGISRMLARKVTTIESAVSSLAATMSAMADLIRPPGDGVYVTGRTAGEIWRAAGFPPIKVTCWFSNRLVQMACQIDGCRRTPVGLGRAKLFDQDKAESWLRNGGRKLVEEYIAHRRGQGRLKLIGETS